MLNDFIDHALSHADDLAELKVSLAALRLLEQKALSVPAPFVTERELMTHPAVRDGLSFPAISLRPALQRAVARGTLLAAQIGDEAPRYFANDPAGRRAVDMLYEVIEHMEEKGARIGSVILEIVREIERLEQVDVYSMSHDDTAQIEEWLACGYNPDEIRVAIQLTLRSLRPRHLPPRGVKDINITLMAAPPAIPSEYFEVMVARAKRMPDEVINLRERLDRPPTPHEFITLRNAVGLFGLHATLDCLKRIAKSDTFNIDALLPALAEQEASSLSLQRKSADRGISVREVVQLYEHTLGVLPTSYVATEIEALLDDFPSISMWRQAFEHAVSVDKKAWAYIKKLITNPSPTLFLPAPINQTAGFAFDMYRRRIGSGILPASVAKEINDLAMLIPDDAAWDSAFTAAESANVLRWNYIRQILRRLSDGANENASSNSEPQNRRQSRVARQVKVDYSPQELAEAEARAEQFLQKLEKRKEKAK